MEEKQVLVRIEDLCKYFRLSSKEELKAVDHVSFDIFRNETVGIVGESGCGKTTLGRTVLGLYPATSGRVLFDGMDVHSAGKREMREFKKRAQIMLQDPYASLNPRMTVRDIIAEGLETRGNFSKAEKDERVCELLSLVGLRPEYRSRYPHEFSGGQRQRIMIAIALACQPKLLIADEPTTALDVTIQADIIDLLKEIQKEFGMAVIMITHDLGIVANIAKKIIVMYAGKVVETGSSQDIFYRPRHPYTKALLRAVPRLDTEEEQSLESIEGTPPNMIDPPAGCAFSTRCSQCMRICQKSEPPMFEFEDGHTAQCWLYHPMAAQGNEE